MANYEENRLSLIAPIGYSSSTCGYCVEPGKGTRSKAKSSKSYGIWAYHITPEGYQQLLDRGWRRSGRYIYRPDCGNEGTCCAQLAVRLDAAAFRPQKQLRHALTALQRLVRSPTDEAKSQTSDVPGPSTLPVLSCSTLAKGKYARKWDVEHEWRLIEWQADDDLLAQAVRAKDASEKRTLLSRFHQERSQRAHEHRKGKAPALPPPMPPRQRRLETTMRIAGSSDEKYALFRKYQSCIHGEKEDQISSMEGFERFLCKGPFLPTMAGQSEPSRPPSGQEVDLESSDTIPFDLYHMEWRLDGRLIAVGVLDVLPRCVSSVYMFYDPDYSDLQLGKASALREIALVRQLQRKKGMEAVAYYSMGLYIHTCPKMRYKAQYGPAEVLDPKSCKWAHLDDVRPQLDRGARFGFANEVTRLPKKRNAPASLFVPNWKDSDVDDDDEEEEEEERLPRPLPPGIEDPALLTKAEIAHCLVIEDGKVELLVNVLPHQSRATTTKILDCLAALGPIRGIFCLVL